MPTERVTDDDLLARRYLARSRDLDLEQMIRHGKAERTMAGARTYDVLRCGWCEWVLVAEDDPRVNTVERFDAD